MSNEWPFKRCSGAHCQIRDNCTHHALPTSDGDGLAYPAHPVHHPEDCLWYDPKDGEWGEIKDSDDLD